VHVGQPGRGMGSDLQIKTTFGSHMQNTGREGEAPRVWKGKGHFKGILAPGGPPAEAKKENGKSLEDHHRESEVEIWFQEKRRISN